MAGPTRRESPAGSGKRTRLKRLVHDMHYETVRCREFKPYGRQSVLARKVSVHLEPNALNRFTSLIERELVPWLRTQEGFRDLITLATSDGTEVQAISFWEQEGWVHPHVVGYPEGVLRVLETLLDGTPSSKTFEVVTSTLERFVPAKLGKAESKSLVTETDHPSLRQESV
jgi:hypothetical protein